MDGDLEVELKRTLYSCKLLLVMVRYNGIKLEHRLTQACVLAFIRQGPNVCGWMPGDCIR